MALAKLPQRLLHRRDRVLERTTDVVQLRPSRDRFPPVAARGEQLLRLPKSALPHAEVGQRGARHDSVEKEPVPTAGQAQGYPGLPPLPPTHLAEKPPARPLALFKQDFGFL